MTRVARYAIFAHVMRQTPTLRELRIKARLTKTALGRLAGLDRTTIIRAESGLSINELSQEGIAQALSQALAREIERTDLFPELEEGVG